MSWQTWKAIGESERAKLLEKFPPAIVLRITRAMRGELDAEELRAASPAAAAEARRIYSELRGEFPAGARRFILDGMERAENKARKIAQAGQRGENRH